MSLSLLFPHKTYSQVTALMLGKGTMRTSSTLAIRPQTCTWNVTWREWSPRFSGKLFRSVKQRTSLLTQYTVTITSIQSEEVTKQAKIEGGRTEREARGPLYVILSLDC
jgi:hypothetical protein